jgi:hypothetical protein
MVCVQSAVPRVAQVRADVADADTIGAGDAQNLRAHAVAFLRHSTRFASTTDGSTCQGCDSAQSISARDRPISRKERSSRPASRKTARLLAHRVIALPIDFRTDVAAIDNMEGLRGLAAVFDSVGA